MKPKLTLREPADIASAVPYLLGFHPADSLVVIGLGGKDVTVVQRWDLVAEVEALCAAIADVLAETPVDAVLLVGYGDPSRVRRAVAALSEGSRAPVVAAVRVEGERCFCELCTECTPEGGVPFDVAGGRIGAQASAAGIATLPSREALVAKVAPLGGIARTAMIAAVRSADERLADLLRSARTAQDPFGGAVLRSEGFRAVDAALAVARREERLEDEQAAWLCLVLHSLPVRDRAWENTDHEPWQLAFWTDLTRRADPALVAPVASILAFAAWRDGDGPLAGVAIERALTCDPHYSLALLIRDAMLRGVSARKLGPWPMPEEPFPARPARRRSGRGTRRKSGGVAVG